MIHYSTSQEVLVLILYQSSSLARHRRIHMGKRPYNSQEPTCKRRYFSHLIGKEHQLIYAQSPCRRKDLMNQHHAQLLQTAIQTPSEDTSSEQLFLSPFANSPLHHQYLYDHQACYPNIATVTHDFYSYRYSVCVYVCMIHTLTTRLKLDPRSDMI